MIQNGSLLLNPCGLIANTYFNGNASLSIYPDAVILIYLSIDIIQLASPSNIEMDSDGLTWSYDSDTKFQQVDGFTFALIANTSQTCSDVLGSGYDDCKSYTDSNNDTYYYYYPDDDTVQYLHETYSDIISPLVGVTDERFINWMRVAGLSNFRKLYGKVDTDISAGDQWTFNLTLNYEVTSYGASKYLVVTDFSSLGSPNYALSVVYILVGSVSLVIGFALSLYAIIKIV